MELQEEATKRMSSTIGLAKISIIGTVFLLLLVIAVFSLYLINRFFP
ncbi:MAG: hypothetical protein GY757_42315 [bacterium]|nr:hypothetical protein [bacterium]